MASFLSNTLEVAFLILSIYFALPTKSFIIKKYILLGNTVRSLIEQNSILTTISVNLDQDENLKKIKTSIFSQRFQTSLRALSGEYYILCPDLWAQKSDFVEPSVLLLGRREI